MMLVSLNREAQMEEPHRSSSVRSSSVRFCPFWFCPFRFSLVRSSPVYSSSSGLVCSALVQSGLFWSSLVRSGLVLGKTCFCPLNIPETGPQESWKSSCWPMLGLDDCGHHGRPQGVGLCRVHRLTTEAGPRPGPPRNTGRNMKHFALSADLPKNPTH